MTEFHRSPDSVGFETYWRALPRQTDNELVPHRDTFAPEEVVEFLPKLVIVKIDLDGEKLPITLAGTATREMFGFEITDRDYFDFVPDELHDDVWDAALEMHEVPCGLWQVIPVSFESRTGKFMEITALPFWGPMGERLAFAMVEMHDEAPPFQPVDKAVQVGTAYQSTRIDLGGEDLMK